jgi:hypothetical protein
MNKNAIIIVVIPILYFVMFPRNEVHALHGLLKSKGLEVGNMMGL